MLRITEMTGGCKSETFHIVKIVHKYVLAAHNID